MIYCSDYRYRERSPIRGRNHSPSISSHRESNKRYEHSSKEGEGSRNIRSSGASSVTRKMDPQELERKRQEMMSSAKLAK